MSYATFWQRLGASAIDFFALLPLALIHSRPSVSKDLALLLVVLHATAFCAYFVYCHARFGQTIGKRVTRIRVARTTGEPIGWREATLRSAVDVLFSVIWIIGAAMALTAITDAHYYGVESAQRILNLAAHEPWWMAWTWNAHEAWFWSEVVVMLFNERRRALHDFIAGTVVISDSARPAQTPTQPNPSARAAVAC